MFIEVADIEFGDAEDGLRVVVEAHKAVEGRHLAHGEIVVGSLNGQYHPLQVSLMD